MATLLQARSSSSIDFFVPATMISMQTEASSYLDDYIFSLYLASITSSYLYFSCSNIMFPFIIRYLFDYLQEKLKFSS